MASKKAEVLRVALAEHRSAQDEYDRLQRALAVAHSRANTSRTSTVLAPIRVAVSPKHDYPLNQRLQRKRPWNKRSS